MTMSLGESFGSGLFGSGLGVGAATASQDSDASPAERIVTGSSAIAGGPPSNAPPARVGVFGTGLQPGSAHIAQAQPVQIAPVNPEPPPTTAAGTPTDPSLSVPGGYGPWQPDQSAMRYGLFGHPLPPRPTADPMQDYANQLQFQRERAARITNNPLAPFLAPEKYKDAVAQSADLDQRAAALQKTFQQQAQLQETARNQGLDPVALNRKYGVNLTQEAILNEHANNLDSGNLNSWRALMSSGDAGKAIIDQHENSFMPALANNNATAAEVINRLNAGAAAGQPAYESTLKQLRGEGIDPSQVLNQYVPNFTVPDKADAWTVRGKGVSGAVAQANQMVNQYNYKQQSYGLLQPVDDEKAAAALQNSYFMGSHGVPIEGGTSVKLASGEVGSILPANSVNIDNYTKPTGEGTWNNENPAKLKEVRDQIGDEQVKDLLSEYKTARMLKETVNDPRILNSASGVALVSEELGAVGRNVEGSMAAGSIGLSKMLETKYGTVGGWLNTASREWSEFAAWVDGGKKGPPPRLSANTIQGIKDIAQFRNDFAFNQVKERVGQPLETAGRYGIALNRTGLDADLQKDPALIGMANQGRQSYINDVNQHKYVVKGSQRIMLQSDSANPEAKTPAPITTQAQGQVPANQQILPSHGHENPPANGDVHLPRSGTTQMPAARQIAYASMPQQNGIASQINPPEPNHAMQTSITPNAASLLSTIRGSESNGTNPNSYNLIVGGKRFTNYDDHPGVVGVVTKNGPSTAAGAYQFTKTTWNDVATRYGALLDRGADGKVSFTPQNQDKAAWLLAQDVYSRKTGGNLEADLSDPAKHNQVMNALSGTWTSLPGGIEANNATGSRVSALRGYLKNLKGLADKYLMAGVPPAEAPAASTAAIKTMANAAPAAGSTVGAVAGGAAGSVLPGPGTVAGGVAGGAAGGAAGQAVKNFVMGRDLAQGVGTEAALGGVQGFVPGSRLLGAAGRVAGGAAIGGTQQAMQPGSMPSDVIKSAIETGGASLAGEAGMGLFGLALGKAGVMFSKFRQDTQQDLADAGAVLAKGKPEAPTGVAGQPVPEAARSQYDTDLKAYNDAVEKAKDHGFDPEDLAHASRTMQQQVSPAASRASLPVAKEQAAIGKGYQEIKQDVAATGVGTPKTVPLTNGPLSMVGKPASQGGIPKTYEARAQEAENNISAPAANWSEKYQQLFDERSRLLEEARAASSSAAPDPNKARALNAMADNVFDHQKAAMQYIFGNRAPAAIAKLQDLHQRYATLMNATKGGDIVANMAKTDADGAAARAAFANYAKDDLGARQAADAVLASKAQLGKQSLTSRVGKYVIAGLAVKLGVPHFAAGLLASEGPALIDG